MPRINPQIDTSIAAEFLTRSFEPEETLAVLLRRSNPHFIQQRFVSLETLLEPRYMAWLAHQNSEGSDIYVGANPLLRGSRKRTKECVAEVRHLYLDLDADGDAKLNGLRDSCDVPKPNAILSTSHHKYQVLWRVEGLSFDEQESELKALAFAFGGDPACTDRNRVLRLPGFLNHKYDPAWPIKVEYSSNEHSRLADFRLNLSTTSISCFLMPRKGTGKQSNSEHDWAWVFRELSRGRDAQTLTRELAVRRSDKSDPLYYSRRTVDVASAWLWLLEGVPAFDIVTMLECRRRFEMPMSVCSARAHEIAQTAQRMISRTMIA